MRIVSLLPSATEIVFALGLGDDLVGVTHECDYPVQARDKPVVTRAVHDLVSASSHQIHSLVEDSMRSHQALYELDEAALEAAHPPSPTPPSNGGVRMSAAVLARAGGMRRNAQRSKRSAPGPA